VATMDSAALYHSVSPGITPRQARMSLRMGITCLRSMARALRVPYDADPLPTADIRLTRHPAHPRRVRRGLRPAASGLVPRRARRGRGLAALQGLAGQLRADCGRAHPHRLAASGALVPGPARAR
jgi:hypothetical protein